MADPRSDSTDYTGHKDDLDYIRSEVVSLFYSSVLTVPQQNALRRIFRCAGGKVEAGAVPHQRHNPEVFRQQCDGHSLSRNDTVEV